MGLSSRLSRPSRRATARATSASPAAGLRAERAPRLRGPPRRRVLVGGREPEQEAAPGAMVGMVVGAEVPIPRVTRARNHDVESLDPIHYSVNVRRLVDVARRDICPAGLSGLRGRANRDAISYGAH
jgi:hypothetical protein